MLKRPFIVLAGHVLIQIQFREMSDELVAWEEGVQESVGPTVRHHLQNLQPKPALALNCLLAESQLTFFPVSDPGC